MRVFSRNAKDWTDKAPAIVEAMRMLPVTSAILDGEGVVASPASSGPAPPSAERSCVF